MSKRRGRRRRRRNSHRKIHRIIDGADFISSMPDDILHHILSFVHIDVAIRTSVLFRRWRHVWCETPCLYVNAFVLKAGGIINQTPMLLSGYTAPKITSFDLCIGLDNTAPQIDSWIEFAISRNVQKLSVAIYNEISCRRTCRYSFPDSLYLSSTVEQLILRFAGFYMHMIPTCTVSWKSIRNLSLFNCKLGDESMDNILSGSPILESLTLSACRLLERLDLSKSLNLRRLEIHRSCSSGPIYGDPTGPIEIVAPHIHYLTLRIASDKQYTLVDVSSLIEANLDISLNSVFPSKALLFQTMALDMLAKSHNAERLTLGPALVQILSLAELRGVPFPKLKVQTLILKTDFARSAIPAIQRLLQNSPGLKKLTVHTLHSHKYIMSMRLDSYSDSQGMNIPDQSKYEVFPKSKEIYLMLGCNDATSKLLASFMELVVRNAKTLETMIVRLAGTSFNDAQWFEELLQMVATLSHNNNVSILVKQSNC